LRRGGLGGEVIDLIPQIPSPKGEGELKSSPRERI